MLKPCTCKKQCSEKISDDQRTKMHEQFWNLSYDARGNWILQHVKHIAVKRRNRKGCTPRSSSYEYSLTDEFGTFVNVCQLMFLNTLGYKSNRKLVTIFTKISLGDIFIPSDKRGRHDAHTRISDEDLNKITDHINSFNPAISHYRCKYAHFCRYLTSELNVNIMYKDFCVQYPFVKVSYSVYCRKLKKMNISFSKLSEEECEVCLIHETHQGRFGETM